MFSIGFSFYQAITAIQCDINEDLLSVCLKFAAKTNIQINNVGFLYNGEKIDEFDFQSTFSEVANSFDKKRKIIPISFFEKGSKLIDNSNNNIIISRDIICPLFKEIIRMKIDYYKITFYECKSEHEINNVLLKEYEDFQIIDELIIICDICKNKNKAESYDKEFFLCNSCKIKLCPLCKSVHNKSHNIVNYDQKNYYCNKHNN